MFSKYLSNILNPNRPKSFLKALASIGLLMVAQSHVQAQNIAVVNGTAIPLKKLEYFLQNAPADKKNDPKVREGIKQNLIVRQLFLDEAQKQKLLSDPLVQFELQEAKLQVIFSHLLKNYINQKFTDEKIKSMYLASSGGDREFLSRHILVKTEEEGKKILAELNKGANFEAIAKAKSLDKGSGANGGLLNWAPAATYVPEFAKALSAMKKNQLLNELVKTQFGFHIIKLDDVREKAMPPIKELREELLNAATQDEAWSQKLLKDMTNDLQKKAKIQ